jgi:hypothetical protein
LKKLDIDRRALASDVDNYRRESLKARDVIADLQACNALSEEENDGLHDKNRVQQQLDSQHYIMHQ